MTEEAYQEIKKISGEELTQLLSELENVFDFGKGKLFDGNFSSLTEFGFA